jgi:hypothetical protein
VKYKTEVLGRWVRIVEDTGSEFENDVAGIGDCHDEDAIALARDLIKALNEPTPVITVKDVIRLAAELNTHGHTSKAT